MARNNRGKTSNKAKESNTPNVTETHSEGVSSHVEKISAADNIAIRDAAFIKK